MNNSTVLHPRLGKALLIGFFVVLFATVVVLPPMVVAVSGVDISISPKFRRVLAQSMVDFALFGALSYLMWLGFGWARWTMAFLLFGGGVYCLPLLDTLKGQAHLMLLGLIVVCLVLSAVLSFVQPIEDFIRAQERIRRLSR